MTLKEEAGKYAENEVKISGDDKLNCEIDFIAGAESRFVEIEKVKYAISILNKFTDEYGWFQAIEDLEKELKQLQQ